ncbi:sulfite exporter TauE/SafE family protein [Thermococcus sp. M39]|uniref:sulfite exporter TauE/SafE family protein n=1 Tax=Thermococcus sp. M39 TaxID=1638262 RepID=UPI001439C868|nr:sulfite exporter TauE/SafE family protein [Thermococcus sp. M39]NJE07661.1 sulfite exporter TauE/SafE family protein [Thermococcus sp. M39]
MVNIIAAIISGFLSGLALGLTGGGGSILAVPLLVYIVGLEPHLAIGTSLVAVGITAFVSSVQHMRRGNVLFKIGLLMGSTSIVGVYIGSYLNKAVEGPVLLILFALLMIFIGVKMIRKKEDQKKEYVPALKTQNIDYPRILGLGLITGLVSGFIGIGGGFLIVPALLWGAGLEMHEAVGTSLFIIFLKGIAGLVSYELQGRPIDFSITAIFVLGGFIGGSLGARIGTAVSGKTLRYAFATLVFIIAAYILVSNIPALNIL